MTELLISKMKEIPMPESIAAMYVYGSIVPGRLRNDSDIDIAILPSFETNDFEKLQLISKVAAIITSALKTIGTDREVSVLDMRGRYVSLQLLYKIITEGTLIYDSDSTQRIDFENAIKRDYFDFEPYLLGLRKRKYGDLYQKA
jgi:predicted nucleotidyltransferase